jgi:holo-[acyl-carrier protein] synthase
MRILGTGVDLAEVARMRAAIEHPRTGARFTARVFTERERCYAESRGRGRFESYAARFAAKEAVMKALGVGWGTRASWLDIEVVRAPGRRPEIVLGGRTAACAAELGVVRLHLALSHTGALAMAQVVLEG